MATSLVTPFINPEDEEQLRGSRIARLLAGSSAPPMPPSNVPVNPMSAGQNPAVMAAMAQQARPLPGTMAAMQPPVLPPQPQSPAESILRGISAPGRTIQGPGIQQADAATGEPVAHAYDQGKYDQLRGNADKLSQPEVRKRPGFGRTLGAILLGALAGPRNAEQVGENVLYPGLAYRESIRKEKLGAAEKSLSDFETEQSRIRSSDSDALNNWYRGKEAQYSQGRLENAEQRTRDLETKLHDTENQPPKTEFQAIEAEGKRQFPDDPAKQYQFVQSERINAIKAARGGKDMSAAELTRAITLLQRQDRRRDEAGKKYEAEIQKKLKGNVDYTLGSPEEQSAIEEKVRGEYQSKIDEERKAIDDETDRLLGLTSGGKKVSGALKGGKGKSLAAPGQGVTPATHVFNKSAWAQANPGQDAEAAAALAKSRGYEVR